MAFHGIEAALVKNTLMRALLIENTFRTDLMLGALAINAVLLIASFGAFLALLRSARMQGSLLSGGE